MSLCVFCCCARSIDSYSARLLAADDYGGVERLVIAAGDWVETPHQRGPIRERENTRSTMSWRWGLYTPCYNGHWPAIVVPAQRGSDGDALGCPRQTNPRTAIGSTTAFARPRICVNTPHAAAAHGASCLGKIEHGRLGWGLACQPAMAWRDQPFLFAIKPPPVPGFSTCASPQAEQ